MSLSRVESHRRGRGNKKNNARRLLSWLLVMSGAALLGIGIYYTLTENGFGLDRWKSAEVASNDPLPGDDGKTSPSSNEGAGGSGTDQPSAGGDDADEDPADLPEDGDAGEGVVSPVDSLGAQSITLSFVGDLLPGEYLNSLMKQNGFDYPYREALLYLSEPDLTAGNLELPVTLNGTPASFDIQHYIYKGHPEALPALRDVGFDVLSLANNHALDQGVEGMLDTIKHLDEVGIKSMGVGNNDKEAFEPVILEAKGIKVAYIGLSRFIPVVEWKADRNTPGIAETYDSTRAVAAIASAKEQADLVVVMVHWGKNEEEKPEPYQFRLARDYIDAGADLVIGSHPHVLQGFEMYKGKWIAYSLGNFVFSVSPQGAWAETGVLDAVCSAEGDCELQFHPMAVKNGQTLPLEDEEAQALLQKLDSISFGAKVGPTGAVLSEVGASDGQ